MIINKLILTNLNNINIKMRDKLVKATMMAQQINSIADRIDFDANDYDEYWPREYAEQLRTIATNFLELK